MKLPYKRTFSIIFLLIISYFIGRVLYREWDKISGYNWSPDVILLVFSVLTLYLVYILGGYGWILIIRMLGVRVNFSKGISIYLLSLFGRYIPGGVWTLLGRVYLCRMEGIPDSRVGISTILEQAYPIVSAGFVFAASLLFWKDVNHITKLFPILIIIPLFIVFIHPKFFLKIINPVISRLGKTPINISLSFNNMLLLVCYYSLTWMVTGTAFYIFIYSFYPLGFSYIPVLSGIYAISFVAGYVTFLTPAGLGVREGSMVILLSLIMPTPIAIGIALLSRLWLIGVELTLLLFFLIDFDTRKMAKAALGW